MKSVTRNVVVITQSGNRDRGRVPGARMITASVGTFFFFECERDNGKFQIGEKRAMANASQQVLLGFVDEPVTDNCSQDAYMINKIGGLPVSRSTVFLYY